MGMTAELTSMVAWLHYHALFVLSSHSWWIGFFIPGCCHCFKWARNTSTMRSDSRAVCLATHAIASGSFSALKLLTRVLSHGTLAFVFFHTEDQNIVTLLSREGDAYADDAVRRRQFARQVTPPRRSFDDAVARNLYRRHRERSRSRCRACYYRWMIANGRASEKLHCFIFGFACFGIWHVFACCCNFNLFAWILLWILFTFDYTGEILAQSLQSCKVNLSEITYDQVGSSWWTSSAMLWRRSFIASALTFGCNDLIIFIFSRWLFQFSTQTAFRNFALAKMNTWRVWQGINSRIWIDYWPTFN